jgi:hypothetical protein
VLAVQRILLAFEHLIMISHYLQRRIAVGKTDQRVNLSGSRSILETVDGHAQDRRHNLTG